MSDTTLKYVRQQLEQLPDDYPWKASLQVVVKQLAQRLAQLPPPPGDDPEDKPKDVFADFNRHKLKPMSADHRHDEPLAVIEDSNGDEPPAVVEDFKDHRPKDELDNLMGYQPKDSGLPDEALPWKNEYALEVLKPLSPPQRLVVVLALTPHLLPGLLDEVLDGYLAPAEVLLLGGAAGTSYRGLLPTGDTAAFVLAGPDPMARQAALADVFGPESRLLRDDLLTLADVPAGEPRFSGRLLLAPAVLSQLAYGLEPAAPSAQPPADFPAQLLETSLGWPDLVLPAITQELLADVQQWLQSEAALRTDWGLARLLKPGFRALFYGPPGTGKTLTATLLGIGPDPRPVYRIDLSLITSKYIGETEKNLGRLFDQAQNQRWILFFDEADALFGKRTETRDAHDRFANQEVAYLLQRIEEYPGLVVLASNLKGNLDPAFARRFQAMIPFPMPTVAERQRLWQHTLPPAERCGPGVDAGQLAASYELSGATILNVVQLAVLRALRAGRPTISQADLVEGIRLEYKKEGKLL